MDQIKTKINICICGAIGMWGKNISKTLYDLKDDVKLTICDINETALNKFKEQYPDIKGINKELAEYKTLEKEIERAFCEPCANVGLECSSGKVYVRCKNIFIEDSGRVYHDVA